MNLFFSGTPEISYRPINLGRAGPGTQTSSKRVHPTNGAGRARRRCLLLLYLYFHQATRQHAGLEYIFNFKNWHRCFSFWSLVVVVVETSPPPDLFPHPSILKLTWQRARLRTGPLQGIVDALFLGGGKERGFFFHRKK